MKNFITILGIFGLLIVFSSCDDDDGGSDFGDLPEELVGTWNSIEFTSSGCADANDNGTCSVGCLSVVFTAEGAATGSISGEAILGTVTANSNTIRLCDPTGQCVDITYVIGSTTVSISWTDPEDGCTYAATIVKPTFPSELVGRWTSNSASASNCDDSTDNGDCENDCLDYTFDVTGAFNGTFGDEPQRTGFGYADGSTLYLCWSGDFVCEEVTYSINGNTGNISWNDDEDGCDYAATVNKQ